MIREDGHAGRDGDGLERLILGVQALDTFVEDLGALQGNFQGSVGYNQEELLTPIAAGDIFPAHLVLDHTAQGDQELISGSMAVSVVVFLEMVQVHHDDPQGRALALVPAQLAFESLIHVAAIEEAGEAVSNGLVPQGLPEFQVGQGQGHRLGYGGGKLADGLHLLLVLRGILAQIERCP